MLNPDDFREFVVRPALASLDEVGVPKSAAAERLVMGTALVESDLRRLVQAGFEGGAYLDGGIGLYQIELATLADLYENFLKFRPPLREGIDALTLWKPGEGIPTTPDFQMLGSQLLWNLAYATIICRLIYWRVPDALPGADDPDGLGHYWKDHYNTNLGKGEPHVFTAGLVSYLNRSRLD